MKSLLAPLAPQQRVSLRPALVTGLIASTAVMLGSWGVGFLASSQRSLLARLSFFVPFRVPAAGVIICTVLLVLGGLLLVRAWIMLGRALGCLDEVQQRTRAVVRVSFAWAVPLLFSFPVFSRDVFSYATQGRLMSQGGNPYHDWVSQMPGWLGEGSDVLWAESSSPYGPLFLAIARLVYWISAGIPEINIVLFRLLALAGMWLTAVALPKLAEHKGSDPSWATWMILANPLWAFSMVASAHNDSLMVGCILLAFAMARSGKTWPALLLATAAIAIKPIVVLGLPFVALALASSPAVFRWGGRRITGLWPRRWASWVTTAAAVGVLMLLLGWATGLWFGWIGAMADQGSAAAPFAPYGLLGWGLGSLLSALGGAGGALQAGFYSIGKAFAVGLALWLALKRPHWPELLSLSLALAAAVLLAPTIQPWYILWVLPLLAAWRSWWGTWEYVAMAVSAVTAVSGLVWQLSIPEWVPAQIPYIVGGSLAVLGLLFLALVDPQTRTLGPQALRPPLFRRVAAASLLDGPKGVGWWPGKDLRPSPADPTPAKGAESLDSRQITSELGRREGEAPTPSSGSKEARAT